MKEDDDMKKSIDDNTMHRKEYIAPLTNVIEIELRCPMLIANSLQNEEIDDENAII